MSEAEFYNKHSTIFRKAVARLLSGDDWRGQYYKFTDLVDALNTLCGYSEHDGNMKKVDVEMITEAFKLKGACAKKDELHFPSSILTGHDSGGDTSRRRSSGRASSGPNNPEKGDEYTFHLYRHKLPNNSEKREYKVGCTRSGDEKPKVIIRGEDWSPPQVLPTTNLWTDMKDQLQEFLKGRKTAAIKNKARAEKDAQKKANKRDRERNRSGNVARLSTPPDNATRQAPAASPSTNTPAAKRNKTSNSVSEDDGNTAGVSANISSVSTEEDLTPLQQQLNETDFQSLLFDDNNCMRENVAQVIMKVYESRFTSEDKLRDHEERVAGCLIKMAFGKVKETDVDSITLRSFSRHRPEEYVRIPTQYSRSDDTNKSRSARRDKKITDNYMQKWSHGGGGNFSHSLVLTSLDLANEEQKKQYRIKLHERFSAEETAIIQEFVGMNDHQCKLLDRAIDCKKGYRIFAPIGQQTAYKKGFIEEEYMSRTYHTIEFERDVKGKKLGGAQLQRAIMIMVMHNRSAENTLMFADRLMDAKALLPSSTVFTVPFTVDEDFVDVIVIKSSIDAGNQSSKMLYSCVNVEKPQSQQNVKYAAEFAGVKDTWENLRRGFFDEKYALKKDFEALMNRKFDIMRVIVGVQARTVIAINLDENHNIYHPKPLVKFSGTTKERAENIAGENKMGIVSIDFTEVASIKILYEDNGNVTGLSFFNSNERVIRSVLFRTEIEEAGDIDQVSLSVTQYLVAGVFTADMALLSTFIGHQGASAKWPSVWKLAELGKLADMWKENRTEYEDRTAEKLVEWASIYKRDYLGKKPSKQTKQLRATITQTMTYSIIRYPLANLPMDCISLSVLHVRLGFTRTLVDFLFDFLECVEDSDDNAPIQFKKDVERQIKKLEKYREWLDSELKDVVKSVESQDKTKEMALERLESARRVLAMNTIGAGTRRKWEGILEQTEDRLRVLEETGDLLEDERELTAQLIEQHLATQSSIDHLNILIKKHDGSCCRIVHRALKTVGKVDIQVYFQGVINGPHCIKFSAKGVEIVESITEEVLNEIRDENMKTAVRQFGIKMKNILRLWHDIQRQCMRTKIQDANAITTFKTNRDDLRRAIVDVVAFSNRTFPDQSRFPKRLKLPTTLKALSLFGDGLMDKWLDNWHNFGAFDEQNTESAHARMNDVSRLFGACRGSHKKQLVMNKLLLRSNRLITDGIDEIYKKTKSKRKRVERRNRPQQSDADDDALPVQTTATEALCSATLRDYEQEMNANEHLRLPMDETDSNEEFDTKIIACPKCFMRLVGHESLAFHYKELHDPSIQAEHDVIPGEGGLR